MKRHYKLFPLRAIFFSFSALLLLASCSSYQYAGYDNDGIYSSDQNEAYTANDYEESYDNALYYQQLFAQKADQFGNVPEEGAIFTDIESYSSGAYDENFAQEDLDYTAGQAAWGTDPDEISINIYNDQFYHPYYHPYYAGFYNPYWGPSYYYGFGYYPYHYGFYDSWRFSIGWGWNSWRYRHHPYYGYPHHPYYSNYYSPYYSYRNVAYNSGRRDAYSYYDRSNRTNLDARSSRVQSYTNPRNVRAARSNYDRRDYQTNSTRVRSTSTPSRRTNSTYNRSRSTNNSSVRRTQNTRSRSNNTSTRTRTSRSSSGNNNATRTSTSNSSRSSGTTTRSSRGRGN